MGVSLWYSRMCKFSGTLRGEAMKFFKECRKCLFVRSFDAKSNVVVVPPVPSFHGTSDRPWAPQPLVDRRAFGGSATGCPGS